MLMLVLATASPRELRHVRSPLGVGNVGLSDSYYLALSPNQPCAALSVSHFGQQAGRSRPRAAPFSEGDV